MADLVAAGLALLGGAAEPLERLVEEGLDVVGLQPSGVGALHCLADALDAAQVHGIVGEDALFHEALKVTAVQGGVEHRGEEGLDLGPLAVADRLDQQVVVDHQVGALEVDALARGVGGQHDLHLRVVLEGLLDLETRLPTDTAVDDDDGVAAAQKFGDAVCQVIEGIAVFGEDDQLLVR